MKQRSLNQTPAPREPSEQGEELSRKEAFAVLELPEQANREEIETRFTMLTRRHRLDDSAAGRERMRRIIEAYDLLSGKKTEREPADPRDLEIVLGRERREWRNAFDYGWKPVVGILIIVSIIFSIIYSALTNEPPDYKITYIGAFADVRERFDGDDWDELLKTEDFAENPMVEVLTLFDGMDPQTEQAIMMKAPLVIAGMDGTDLLILDKKSFERYGAQGAFDPLDTIYPRLARTHAAAMEKYAQKAMNTMKEAPDDDPLGEPQPVEEPRIYGIDLSTHAPLQGLGIIGGEQILAIPVQSGRKERTEQLFDYLLEHLPEFEASFAGAVAAAEAEQE